MASVWLVYATENDTCAHLGVFTSKDSADSCARDWNTSGNWPKAESFEEEVQE